MTIPVLTTANTALAASWIRWPAPATGRTSSPATASTWWRTIWSPAPATGTTASASTTRYRVIYIGETEGGCCGDDDLFAELETSWREAARHVPVQWHGIHDVITVYERRSAS